MVDAQELARLIGEFGKAYTRRVWSEMTRAGTTPARARLLAALQCQGSRKMSELGVELGVTPRNITKLVDGLESEGLVARQAHPSDRRATLVCITETGKQVGKESALADGAAATWLYKQLGPTDCRHLTRILRKLLAKLAECGADTPCRPE